MDLESLAAEVRSHFRAQASRYGLNSADLRVESVLNWGGFVNAHFEVGDSRHRWHLKLTNSLEGARALRRWAQLSAVLETSYHAPRLIERVELNGTGFEGLLFERSSGSPVDLLSSPSLLRDVLRLVRDLHRDDGLARELAVDGIVGAARRSILAHYIECLEADLEESGDRYPVSRETVAWMRGEVAILRGMIEAESSFDEVRATPVHEDLWAGNILAETSDRWIILDWDGLTLGDPVLDYAVLLWPLVRQGADAESWLGADARDDAFMRRFRLCARANLLDDVIDSLADWVEAEAAPTHVQQVRAKRLADHERALHEYRNRYS